MADYRPRVAITVLTYDRPRELRALLDDLEREQERYDVALRIRVCDDASPRSPELDAAREQTLASGGEWLRADRRCGRDRHWRLVSRSFAALRDDDSDLYLFLPDDVRLLTHFFARLLRVWEQILDADALHPAVLAGREGSCWTRGSRRRVADGAAFEIGWIDGLYLARPRLLELLDYRVKPISPQPGLGSRVGAQLSRRLDLAGARLYRVDESLLYFPQPSESIMNPELRELKPAIALRPVGDRDPHSRVYSVRGRRAVARVVGDERCHVSRSLLSGRYYERPLLEYLATLVPEGATVFDVGAHVGNHSAYFALEIGASRVVSVEPSLTSYMRLRDTISLSRIEDRVRAVRAAVGVGAGATVLESDPSNTGMTRVLPGGPCPFVALDDLGPADLVKVDVEGSGAVALATGSRLLRESRPVVAVEAATADELAAVRAVLDPAGYGDPTGPYGATPVWVFRGEE